MADHGVQATKVLHAPSIAGEDAAGGTHGQDRAELHISPPLGVIVIKGHTNIRALGVVDGGANTVIKDVDRPLLVINDCMIKGTTRFQKYGFLLHKQYKSEMKALKEKYGVEFYSDWVPHYYGPYSRSLANDLEACIAAKTITKVDIPTIDDNKKVSIYNLTIKGRFKWRKLFMNVLEVSYFVEKIRSMQSIPYYTLLSQIYTAYPDFARKSRIRSDVAANTAR